LVAERQNLIDIQVEADPLAPTTLLQRVEGVVTQPFLTPAMHFEVAYWASAEPITNEISRYMASPLSGLQFGWLMGIPLTLLAALGIAACMWPGLHPQTSRAFARSLVVWLAVTIISLLVNPLPWQRYYLPLYPVASLLAGVGLQAVADWIVQKRKQNLSTARLPISAS
jgi:hypothetical protein